MPGHASKCFEYVSCLWVAQNLSPHVPHEIVDMQWMQPPVVRSLLPQHEQPIVSLTNREFCAQYAYLSRGPENLS